MIMFSEIEIWSISEIRHFEFSAIIENAQGVPLIGFSTL